MKRTILVAACAVAAASFAVISQAADHIDSPAAVADPDADLTDLYAWTTPDASKLNLALNWFHMAPEDQAFSDAVAFTFHVNSSATFGAASTETLITCKFFKTDGKGLECWIGANEYVAGDPSNVEGLVSESGMTRVFAGRRDDPFFFELVGFKETVKTVVAAAPSLTFDTNGCPDVDDPTSTTLVTQLQRGMNNAPASNTFAGSKVQSIVLQIDKSLVTPGGPIVGVWASSHSVQ
jgi:hypothetical protein